MLALTVLCIISSCNPFFAAWSAFSLSYTVFQYGICVNLDAVSLVALVSVCMSSFLLFSMFTAVKESVCMVILSLVPLAFSSATRMAVI